MTKSHKILIVEDEPELMNIFSSILKSVGFIVEVARDGKTALEKIKVLKPDLIILDLVIPELDGYEVLARIKKSKDTKNIPVYVWSNLTQKDEIAKANQLGADGYLIKSDYTPSRFAEKVKEILKSS